MPPYAASFPIGTRVRVASAEILAQFRTDWAFHNPLQADQMRFAGADSTVGGVTYYHGGDALYELAGVPGVWHEACLLELRSR